MKRTTVLIIAAIICLFASGAHAAQSDEYYITAAVKLLDLSKPELSEVKTAADTGDYTKALEIYRDIFFKRAQGYADKGYMKSARSPQAGRADDLLQNYVNIGDDSGNTRRLYMGESGKWNWFYNDNAWARYGNRLSFLSVLPDTYISTGNIEYLKKFISIFEDFDTNFVNQYNEYVQNKGVNLADVNVGFFRVGQLYNDFRLNERFYALMDCMRYKPEEITALYDNLRFAKMLLSCNEDAVSQQTHRKTPNQFEIALTGQARAYVFLQDMPTYIAHYNKFLDSLREHLKENILPDGGAPEMALHYNYEFVTFINGIKEPFELLGDYPDWYKDAQEKAKYRVRMLASVLMPDGTNPNLAEDYTAWDVWSPLKSASDKLGGVDVAEAYYARFKEGKDAKPAFTSIAFPYVGYYVMRNNWDKDSQYLFFTGSRFGAGHVEMNRLEVKYAAFGERLLGSSPASYSTNHAKFNNYMYSSVSNNTVRVDDYSQKRTIDAYSDFSTPEKGIWHSSSNFDYAEGAYTDGYNTFIGTWDTRKDVLVADVTHNRGVLMDKENEIAVVTDILSGATSHNYKLAWNFEEKFNTYDSVAVNAEEKWIKTCLDDGKAGVELYNMYDGDLKYNARCGEEYEDTAVGWWLHKYGTDFKPAVHTDTVFDGAGKTTISTLIVPTLNNKSNIKSLQRNDYGFCAEFENGNKVTFQNGKKNSNRIEAGGFSFNGKAIYIVERPDGSAWGMLLNPMDVKYKGNDIKDIKENVEFAVENGEVKIVSAIKAPTGFSWKEEASGAVPDYGYDIETRFKYR